MWPHSCMHDGYIYVARGEECSWCGGKEEDEPQGKNVVVPILKL
jgi:quercetin dioxygenase-like cupin family protein